MPIPIVPPPAVPGDGFGGGSTGIPSIEPTPDNLLFCVLTGLCEGVNPITLGTIIQSICDEDSDEERCDRQYYEVDIPTCRGIARARGNAAAARCYASAADRYAACLAGRPIPPLDTYNN